MKSIWLHQHNRSHLILFFAGWGMDERPFRRLTSERSDVLMLCDHRDLALPVEVTRAVGDYERVDAIGWSFGVAVAAIACEWIHDRITRGVAVGGTLWPIDEDRGIPPRVFQRTLEGLSEDNYERFVRRMCGDAATLDRFNQARPARSLEELREELVAMRDHFTTLQPAPSSPLFQSAWVPTRDRIIPTENQLAAWESLEVRQVPIDAAHFPFYNWSSWEDLLSDAAD